MSALLTQAIIRAGTRMHTLKRVRLGELSIETDLGAFRAPFGTKWHRLGAGHAAPELIDLSGAVEGTTPTESKQLLNALLADLPNAAFLALGAWELPVLGNTGATTTTPTLAGWRIQFTLIRAEVT